MALFFYRNIYNGKNRLSHCCAKLRIEGCCFVVMHSYEIDSDAYLIAALNCVL